jgi:hypothetical protein
VPLVILVSQTAAAAPLLPTVPTLAPSHVPQTPLCSLAPSCCLRWHTTQHTVRTMLHFRVKSGSVGCTAKATRYGGVSPKTTRIYRVSNWYILLICRGGRAELPRSAASQTIRRNRVFETRRIHAPVSSIDNACHCNYRPPPVR